MDPVARQLLGVFAILMSLVMLGLGIAVNLSDAAWRARLMFGLIGLNSWVVAAQGWTWLRLYYDLNLIDLSPNNPHLWRAKALAQEHLRELTEAVARGRRDCLVLGAPRDHGWELPPSWLHVYGMEGNQLVAWHPEILADGMDTIPSPLSLDSGPYAVPVTGPTAVPGSLSVRDPKSDLIPTLPGGIVRATARLAPSTSPPDDTQGTPGSTIEVGSDAPPPTATRFRLSADQVWDFCIPSLPSQNEYRQRGYYTCLARLQTLLDRGYRPLPAQRHAVELTASYEHWGFPST